MQACTETDIGARIERETVVTHVPLVPELRLRLITHECRLWHAGEAEAAAAGLPEPYWAFAWPGGQALARHVLDHPHLVRGRRVLDFGSGGALEGLAALMAGASSVVAADLDPVAAIAARLNADLNLLEGPRDALRTETADLLGTTPDVDLVLAGDVFYDRDLAEAGRAWLEALHRRGVDVLIGDPSRGFLDLGGLVPVTTYRAGADGDVTGREWRETGVWTFGGASGR